MVLTTTPSPMPTTVTARSAATVYPTAGVHRAEAADTQVARILFWSRSEPPWNRLSTFAGPAEYRGRVATCWECFYQTERFVAYPELREYVMRSSHGAEARRRAFQFARLARKNWPAVRLRVMRELVEERFRTYPDDQGRETNRDLVLLKQTGNAELVLLSPWGDCYWGWYGRGANHYGKMLMQRRVHRHGDGWVAHTR